VTREQIDELIGSEEGILLADGFEEAFLGIGQQFNTRFAVYDRAKCISILMESDSMTEEDAEEFFEFNTQGAYVGKSTPCFLVLGEQRAGTN
jgi:hypothetical protein